MKCCNVIVFYNNQEEVEKYITEAWSVADHLTDIIIVVNSDKKHQVEQMTSRLRTQGINQFSVVDYGDNVGYLNALLKTIKQIDLQQYDYYILSNTDIHYDTKDFFQQLVTKAYPQEVGCIAPSVYNPNSRSYSNPHYTERIPRSKLLRVARIFKYPLLGRIYLGLAGMKAGNSGSIKKPSCYVYSPHGCYMIFTRAFITKICNYEYGVRLYSEESAIGELLLRHNMKCYYDNSIQVIHDESSVTGKMNYRKRFDAWRASLEYILNEFYG